MLLCYHFAVLLPACGPLILSPAQGGRVCFILHLLLVILPCYLALRHSLLCNVTFMALNAYMALPRVVLLHIAVLPFCCFVAGLWAMDTISGPRRARLFHFAKFRLLLAAYYLLPTNLARSATL